MLRRIAAVALALLMALPVVAQEMPYTLSGQVLDQDGQPVAGVAVYLYQYGYDVAYDESSPDGYATGSSASSEPASASARPAPENYHEAKTQTGADGRWSLPARAGDASLSFVKEGYAGGNEYLSVAGDQQVDAEILRYPDASVRLTGSFDGPLGSISIEYPQYGLYVCSQRDGDDVPKPMPADTMEAESAMIAPGEPYPGYQGCAITVHADGSFEGDIYPGYALVRAYADWREDAQYYPFVETRTFVGDARLDIALAAKPGPDATFGGYVLGVGDVPLKAQLSFSNLDNYGWGQAQTDGDGSFKVALHSGPTEISIWADGHLLWVGVVNVRGESLDFVARLTPGESRYGGCCWAYAESDEVMVAMPASAAAQGERDASAGGNGAQDASSFKDLGGGLGAYEAPEEDAPGFALVGLLVGLVAAAALRRR